MVVTDSELRSGLRLLPVVVCLLATGVSCGGQESESLSAYEYPACSEEAESGEDEPDCTSHPELCGTHATTVHGEVDRADHHLVFLSSGFSGDQLDAYRDRVDRLVSTVRGESTGIVGRAPERFSITRIDISGEGRPLGGCLDYHEKPDHDDLEVDEARARLAARRHVSAADAIVVLMNDRTAHASAESPIYKAPDTPAIVRMHTRDGADVLIHELGHALVGLEDEYSSYEGCFEPPDRRRESTVGDSLPRTSNLTLSADAPKWNDLVDGAVEGGDLKSSCVYHPTDRCRMLDSDHETFCPVCDAAVDEFVYGHDLGSERNRPPACRVAVYRERRGPPARSYKTRNVVDVVAFDRTGGVTVDLSVDGRHKRTISVGPEEWLVDRPAADIQPFLTNVDRPVATLQPGRHDLRVTCRDGLGAERTLETSFRIESSPGGDAADGDTADSRTCASGARRCDGACAVCPSAVGIEGYACSGAKCVVEACEAGFERCTSGCCTTGEVVAGGASRVSGAPAVAEPPEGRLEAVYFDRRDRTLEYARRTSDGWTFSVVDRDVRYGGEHREIRGVGDPELAFSDQGRPHVVYDPANTGMRYATREDGEWTVYQLTDPDSYPNDVAMAAGADERIHVAYVDQWDETFSYATFDDSSWTLRTSTAIDPHGLRLALDADGTPHVVYGTSGDGEEEWNIEHAVWTGERWEIEGVTRRGYSRVDVADFRIGSASFRVLWNGRPSGESRSSVYYASTPVGASDGSWEPERIEGIGSARGLSVGTAETGRPQVAYMGVPDDDWMLKHATRTSSGWQTAATGDSVPDRGAGRRLQAAATSPSSGVPQLVYVDPRYDNLNARHRADENWHTEVVDHATPILGRRVHLSLGPEGEPEIVYWDRANRRMRFAVVNSDGWSRSTVPLEVGHPKHVEYGAPVRDGSGDLVVAFADLSGVFATRRGASGWATREIADDMPSSFLPEIAADPAGRPHVAYVGDDAYVHHWYDGSRWRRRDLEPIPASDDGGYSLSEARHQYDLVAGGGGELQVYSHGDAVRRHVQAGRSWESDLVADVPATSKDVTLDGGGAAHVSYQTDETLRYARRTDDGWVDQVVDRAGGGRANAVAVDSRGRAYILYHRTVVERPGARTRVGELAVATNASGEWSTRTLVPGPRVGPYLTVERDASGQLHLAYFDHSRGAVVYQSLELPL